MALRRPAWSARASASESCGPDVPPVYSSDHPLTVRGPRERAPDDRGLMLVRHVHDMTPAAPAPFAAPRHGRRARGWSAQGRPALEAASGAITVVHATAPSHSTSSRVAAIGRSRGFTPTQGSCRIRCGRAARATLDRVHRHAVAAGARVRSVCGPTRERAPEGLRPPAPIPRTESPEERRILLLPEASGVLVRTPGPESGRQDLNLRPPGPQPERSRRTRCVSAC